LDESYDDVYIHAIDERYTWQGEMVIIKRFVTVEKIFNFFIIIRTVV